jgi:hypothetical protein
MRSQLRVFFIAVVAIAMIAGVVGQASANTELVPASRLVAPFFDISSGRATFLILTNVSRRVFLDGTQFACGAGLAFVCGPFGVHLEFYGQSCNRVDTQDQLSPTDIDQFDLFNDGQVKGASGTGGNLGPVPSSATQSGLGGRGWVDIDVRQSASPSFSDPSAQANVLLGTVVITDSGSDFALAYPMASGIGTSASGLLGRIVRRDGLGKATAWNGRYEPFPPRTFLPAFFAEGIDTSPPFSADDPNLGTNFTAFLVMAGPADGNWDNSGNGEAPGQAIGRTAGGDPTGGPGEPLLNIGANIYDGCEHTVSNPFQSHYVNNFLNSIFAGVPLRNLWTVARCAGPVVPSGSLPFGRDELSVSEDPTGNGQAVGWADLPNLAIACDQTTAGTGSGNCPGYTGASTETAFRGAGNGTGQRRGVVGLLIETAINAGFNVQLGDVTRLWGDPSPWEGRDGGGPFPDFALCLLATQTNLTCTYSLVDLVTHADISQQGTLVTAVPTALSFP